MTLSSDFSAQFYSPTRNVLGGTCHENKICNPHLHCKAAETLLSENMNALRTKSIKKCQHDFPKTWVSHGIPNPMVPHLLQGCGPLHEFLLFLGCVRRKVSRALNQFQVWLQGRHGESLKNPISVFPHVPFFSICIVYASFPWFSMVFQQTPLPGEVVSKSLWPHLAWCRPVWPAAAALASWAKAA